MCASYHREYGVNVKIARLAQTFGAGISLKENRVFAQFANSVINGEGIVLRLQASLMETTVISERYMGHFACPFGGKCWGGVFCSK